MGERSHVRATIQKRNVKVLPDQIMKAYITQI